MERGIERLVYLPARPGWWVGGRRVTASRHRSAVEVAAVWRDAVRTLGAHAAPILACAGLGCAGPAVLAGLVGLTLDGNQPPALCPFRTLPGAPWLLPVLAAALLPPLACGVIARIAWHGPDQRSGLGATVRAVLARLPALVLGWLAYGVLMTGALAGLAPALHDAQLDPPGVRASVASGWSSRPAASLVPEVTVRGVNTLLPDPGLAWCEVAAVAAHVGLFNPPPAGGSVADPGYLGDPRYLIKPVEQRKPGVPRSWLPPLAGLASLLLFEVLLRFRVVTAVQPGRVGSFWPLLRSLRLAVRHFASVAGHVWSLRLAVTGAHVLLVVLPVVLARQIVVPEVTHATGLYQAQLGVTALSLAGVALIDGILTAFCTVYDARLFVALQRAERGKEAPALNAR